MTFLLTDLNIFKKIMQSFQMKAFQQTNPYLTFDFRFIYLGN